MKILLLAPRYVNPGTPVYDYSVWNFYLPLRTLGHEVEFFDLKTGTDSTLQARIESFKPDLLFCIMTGDQVKFPSEPWETITRATEGGNVQTFNWFCDDAWRFDTWSSKVCHHFHACSTTEPGYQQRYGEIYGGPVFEANWHANSDLYSALNVPRGHDIAFVGTVYPDRAAYINHLEESGVGVKVYSRVSFEEMVWIMSSHQAVLSFAFNPNGQCTQMKARPFEVAAAGGLLLQEHHEGMVDYFGKTEAVYFKNKDHLLNLVWKLQEKPLLADKVAENGYRRFLEDHTSEIRLRKLLTQVTG